MVEDIIERIKQLTFCNHSLRLSGVYDNLELFEHMDLVFVSYDREYFELAETTAIQYNIIPLLNKYLEQATELLDDAAGRYYNACKRLLDNNYADDVTLVSGSYKAHLRSRNDAIYFNISMNNQCLMFGACYSGKVILKRYDQRKLFELLDKFLPTKKGSGDVQKLKDKFQSHNIDFDSEQFYDQLIQYATMFSAAGRPATLKEFVSFLENDIGW